MAGQIHEWMKDGGVDIGSFLQRLGGVAGRGPLDHVVRALQPGLDTVVGGAKVLRDASGVVGGAAVDASRDAVYRLAGLQPNDPSGYADANATKLANSTRNLAQAGPDVIAPARKAFGSIRDMLRSSLESSGTPLPEEEATPTAVAAAPAPQPAVAPVVQRTPVAAVPAQRAAGGGVLAAASPVPVNQVAGALPSDPRMPGGVTPQPSVAQEAAIDTAPQGKGLAELFRERMDQIPQVEMNKLSGDQKNQLALQFFMNLMARGGQRGSDSVLGNIGSAGLDTLQSSRFIQNQNTQNLIGQRTRESENAFRELTLADRDTGNQTNARRLDIMEQSLREGKWSIHETEGGHVLIDDKGNTKPLPGNIKLKSKDNKDSAIQLLEHFKKHPKDLELFAKINKKGESGRGDDGGKISQKEYAKLVLDHNKGGNEFEPRSLEESQAAIDRLLGRKTPGAATTSKPTGDASISHLPKDVQQKASEIKALVNAGKMTKEQAIKKLKLLGI